MNKPALIAFVGWTVFFTLVGWLGGEVLSQLSQYAGAPELAAMVPHAEYLCVAAEIIQLVIVCVVLYFTRITAPPLWTVLLAGCATFLVASRALQYSFGSDDSYIFFRYVQQWIETGAPNYNPSEKVLGFSSYLYMAVLTLAALLSGTKDIVACAHVLNLVFQTATFWLLLRFALIVLNNRWLALLSVFIFSSSAYLISEFAMMQETSLVCFLIAVALNAIVQSRPNTLAWSTCSLFLTRPEGLFWAAVSFIYCLRKTGPKAILNWIIPGAAVLAIYLSTFLYFGTVMPHGALAKSLTFYNVPPFTAFMDVLAAVAHTSFDNPLGGSFPGDHPFLPVMQSGWILGTLTVVQSLAIIAALYALARKRAWLMVYAIATTIVGAFLALKAPLMFSWYFSWFALLPCLLIPVAVQELREKGKIARAVAWALIAQAILLPIWQYPRSPFFMFEGLQPKLLVYQRIADYANSLSPKAENLAAFEIGVIGYRFNGKILDLGGLVSDEVLQYFPVPPEMRADNGIWSIPPDAVNKLKPDLVIVTSQFEKKGLLKDGQFLAGYEMLQSTPCIHWGDIQLYRRKLSAH